MNRVQVQDLPQAPAIIPRARPVDTFVAPPPINDSNPLADLSNALEEFRPRVDKFLQGQKEELDKKQLAEGVQAYEKSRKDFAQAVKEGLIPAGASPHYRRGYRAAQLRSLGRKFQQELQLAYETEGWGDQSDPAVLEAGAQKVYQKFVEENLQGFPDAEVIESFLPVKDRVFDQMFNQHTQEQIEQVELKYRQEWEQQVTGLVDVGRKTGNWKQVGETISALASEMIKDDPKSARWVNAVIYELAKTAAIETKKGGTAATILSSVATPGGSLANTAEGRKIIAESAKAATDAYWTSISRQHQLEAWAHEKKKRQIEDLVADNASELNSYTDVENFIRKNNITGAFRDIVTKAYTSRASAIDTVVEIPEVKTALIIKAHVTDPEKLGPVLAEIQEAREQLLIHPDTEKALVTLLFDRRDNNRRPDPLLSGNPLFSQEMQDSTQLMDGTVSRFQQATKYTGSTTPMRLALNRAHQAHIARLVEWTRDNPPDSFATSSEREAAFQKKILESSKFRDEQFIRIEQIALETLRRDKASLSNPNLFSGVTSDTPEKPIEDLAREVYSGAREIDAIPEEVLVELRKVDLSGKDLDIKNRYHRFLAILASKSPEKFAELKAFLDQQR